MYAAPAQRLAADHSAGEAPAPRDRDDREDSPGAGFRGAKRRQVKKACAHCRKGHRCCEEQRPCKRCKRKGLPCDDGEPQKPRFKLYPTELPPGASPMHGARGMARPQIPMAPYGVTPEMLAYHILNQNQLAQGRFPGAGDQEMSLTDTVGMAFKPMPVDARSVAPAAAASTSFSGSPFQWTSTHPSVAIPTPLSLAASTELHHSLVQSINNLRNSVPSADPTRNPSDLTSSLPRSIPSQDIPPGGPAQSQGNPDSAFDVLRNSFFSLRESLAPSAPALPAAAAKETVRLPNPLLHTAALVQAPPPASLPALYQRITSLTTSAPPAIFVPPPLRFPHPGAAPSSASAAAPNSQPAPAGNPQTPTKLSQSPQQPALAYSTQPTLGAIPKGDLRSSPASGSGNLADSASL